MQVMSRCCVAAVEKGAVAVTEPTVTADELQPQIQWPASASPGGESYHWAVAMCSARSDGPDSEGYAGLSA